MNPNDSIQQKSQNGIGQERMFKPACHSPPCPIRDPLCVERVIVFGQVYVDVPKGAQCARWNSVATVLEEVDDVWGGWNFSVGILHIVFERNVVFETPETSCHIVF